MNFEYFDIHSHLSFPDYDSDREEIIAEMKENKIGTIGVGVDFDTSKKELELAEKHQNIFACVGQHPSDLKTDSKLDERLIDLAKNSKAVAIGECGLDYFGLNQNPALSKTLAGKQKEIFKKQIELAIKIEKPLMLHTRPSDKVTYDAYFDCLDILEGYAKDFGEKIRGNAHFFVGSMEVLKRFLNIGFSVSFGGVITFTDEYNEYIKYTPIDMIHSETDAPFVAPEPYRGKRNSSLYLPQIVKKMAEIRMEKEDFLKENLINNAKRLFNLP